MANGQNSLREGIEFISKIIGTMVIIISVLYTIYSFAWERFQLPAEVDAHAKQLKQVEDWQLDMQYNMEVLLRAQGLEWKSAPDYWKKIRANNYQ